MPQNCFVQTTLKIWWWSTNKKNNTNKSNYIKMTSELTPFMYAFSKNHNKQKNMQRRHNTREAIKRLNKLHQINWRTYYWGSEKPMPKTEGL